MGLQKSILKQSIPSLLLSLVTLSLVGKKLSFVNGNNIFKYYPLLLVTTCILSFKGNIEMCYALYLRYNHFRFVDFVLTILQSACIGLCVGFLGIAGCVFCGITEKVLLFKLIMNGIYSCIISTSLILLMIFLVVYQFSTIINPDNIVLPLISSISEYISVVILIYFLIYLDISFKMCTIIFLPILLVFLVYYFASRNHISTMNILQSNLQTSNFISTNNNENNHDNPSFSQKYTERPIALLISVYLLSTLSGVIIEYFSKKHPYLASSSPVFCGLTGSTSYIYLNRKISNIYRTTQHNKFNVTYTLSIISLIISILYIIFSIFITSYSIIFSLFFIIFFVLDVVLLIEIIDIIIKWLLIKKIEVGSIMIPLLSSIADFLGCFFLVLIVKIAL